MKSLMVAVVAVLGLGGCIAVPAPYYAAEPYYYTAPAVGVGIYAPVYRGHYHRRHWR